MNDCLVAGKLKVVSDAPAGRVAGVVGQIPVDPILQVGDLSPGRIVWPIRPILRLV